MAFGAGSPLTEGMHKLCRSECLFIIFVSQFDLCHTVTIKCQMV
jgi:hypothetical protein